jgi:hypothetical protein
LSLIDQFEVQFNELSNFELVDGSLSEIQPVELAGMLNQEMNRAISQIGLNAQLVGFNIYLSNHDFTRLEKYRNLIIDGLLNLVDKTAELKRIENLGHVEVNILKDSSLSTGVMKCIPLVEALVQVSETIKAYILEIGGMKKQLEERLYVLGRGTDVDIQINDSGISRKHLSIEISESISIKDLNSTNGTFVNGERIIEYFADDEVTFKIGTSEIKIYRDLI